MQQYGAAAYQTTAKTVESPREREAALLIKSAASLQSVRDNWPADSEVLKGALTFNRKLWTIFMTSVTRDDNALPAMVRQNIANLGMYILNETREILLDPVSPNRLDTLININRQLAQGLRAN
ncbi:flagellar biosynthesis regulatory protein FlaF [Devosia sp. LC5]|jgi:flagellar protein FlaF|uniref:flagellar biosynthesis regulator FlaF n=1 Tax=unclassified Devosia TaxID=196773 RepID=UPI0004E3D1FA|nr:flagellar biosynthesis regulator FlaF [Devosia sp. LC5]KFC69114.1 flagellar biosynthesis regulatory protein FlaF [Devosia sp. LC5]